MEEIGVKVENEVILKKLEEYGARIDRTNQRAYFSVKVMGGFLAESEPVEFDLLKEITTGMGDYHRFYMTPDGEIEPFTQKTMINKKFLYLGGN